MSYPKAKNTKLTSVLRTYVGAKKVNSLNALAVEIGIPVSSMRDIVVNCTMPNAMHLVKILNWLIKSDEEPEPVNPPTPADVAQTAADFDGTAPKPRTRKRSKRKARANSESIRLKKMVR